MYNSLIEMAKQQLAIINQDTKEYFVYGKDTVQIYEISSSESYECSSFCTYSLQSFSLLDDASIKCISQINVNRELELEFTTPVPKENKYKISLYYFDTLGQLNLHGVLNAENIRQGQKFRFSFRDTFFRETLNRIREYNGTIIICCKISKVHSLNLIKNPALSNVSLNDLQQKSKINFSQANDCSLLFENASLSNLTISVENKEFKVHKEILAAKSSVFLAMFETQMKEKRENHVKIEDIEANVFQEFLRYIYTNKVNDMYAHAEKLYKAADKYDLSNLKLICIDTLSRSLTVENAIKLFSFADENNETGLKETTMDFIKKQMKLIFQTEGYKALRQSPKAYLIDEIFQATFNYVCTE